MKTNLDPNFLAPVDLARADTILRSCVHCGFCTDGCPTYQLLGDENDSPRGRIYLIKDMFETGQVNAAQVTHLDRCLSCRNCETNCPLWRGLYGFTGYCSRRHRAATDQTLDQPSRALVVASRLRVAWIISCSF